MGGYPISEKTILRPGATLETLVYDKVVYTLEEAEEYIRDFFQRGLKVIEQYYPYTDEKELLENLPVNLDGSMGMGYCLARVVLHDFDFVWRYINDEIKTVNPKSRFLPELKKILPIWEKTIRKQAACLARTPARRRRHECTVQRHTCIKNSHK